MRPPPASHPPVPAVSAGFVRSEALSEPFPWVSSRTLRFTPQGEFPLAFSPECPLRIMFFRFSVDHRLTPSFHDYLEFSLICEGMGRFIVENRPYPVEPGDVVLVGSREFHLLEASRDQVLRAASVHFRPEWVHAPGGSGPDQEYLTPFRYRDPVFSHRIPRAALPANLVRDRIAGMHRAIQAGGAGFPLIVKTYLADILLEISRHFRRAGGQAAPQAQRVRDSERLREVFNFLRKNCHEPVCLDQVARMAHLSRPYFCRFFKAVTGVTLTEYVLRLRVDSAMEFLSSSALSVAEIAYATGFSSHSHLDRVFKRLIGVTPLEYRRQLKV